jgi:hypothetical protein
MFAKRAFQLPVVKLKHFSHKTAKGENSQQQDFLAPQQLHYDLEKLPLA